MKPARLSFVPVVVLLAFVATISNANEDTKSNPYESIAARNPFQLKDPPPPPDPNDVPKPPPPPLATVEVTGVMNLGLNGKKLVLLEIVPGPGKPPLKPTLTEGERVESVEVLFIDVDEGSVKINNGGVITNIALKAPTKSPTGPVPPLPGVQPGFPPPVLQPNATAGIVPTVNPNLANPNASQYNNNGRGNVMVVGGSPTPATPTTGLTGKPVNAYGGATAGGTTPVYGSAPIYNPNSGASAIGGAGVSGGSGVTVTGGDLPPRTIPTRPIRTQTSATPDPTHNDPAAQYINMAIQKQQMESRGRPMPPLPPIPGFDPNQ